MRIEGSRLLVPLLLNKLNLVLKVIQITCTLLGKKKIFMYSLMFFIEVYPFSRLYTHSSVKLSRLDLDVEDVNFQTLIGVISLQSACNQA